MQLGRAGVMHRKHVHVTHIAYRIGGLSTARTLQSHVCSMTCPFVQT